MEVNGGSLRGNKLAGEYTLPVANIDAIGGVKSGADIEVDATGSVTVKTVNGKTPAASDHTHTLTVSDIPQDETHRFVTDTEKTDYAGKETTAGSQAKADAALASAKSYADEKVAGIVDSSPEALDTLKELATALNNDANFATTMTNQLAAKAAADHNHDSVYLKKPTKATFTLTAAGWTGSAAPYEQTVTVNGVTADSEHVILPTARPNADALAALQAANIQDGGQTANQITLMAYGDKPTIDIPMRITIYA